MAKNTRSNYTNAVRQAVAFIEENLEDDLCLDIIAAQTGYSKYHLNRFFTEIVGTTIYKYIQGRRLDRAAEMLVHTDAAISGIALQAGYSGQQAFTLAFRREYHRPPQQYRNEGRYVSKYPIYSFGVESFRMSGNLTGRCAA